MLSKQKYLTGEEFTLADVAVSSYLLYVPQFFQGIEIYSKWKHVARYMRDCASRELYGKAFGAGTQNYLVQEMDKQIAAGGQDKKLFGLF